MATGLQRMKLLLKAHFHACPRYTRHRPLPLGVLLRPGWPALGGGQANPIGLGSAPVLDGNGAATVQRNVGEFIAALKKPLAEHLIDTTPAPRPSRRPSRTVVPRRSDRLAAKSACCDAVPERQARRVLLYVAPIRDTDTPIPIRRYCDTAFSKNKDTPIRQAYIKNSKI
jgi:hypothetical protein